MDEHTARLNNMLRAEIQRYRSGEADLSQLATAIDAIGTALEGEETTSQATRLWKLVGAIENIEHTCQPEDQRHYVEEELAKLKDMLRTKGEGEENGRDR